MLVTRLEDDENDKTEHLNGGKERIPARKLGKGPSLSEQFD